MEDGGSGSRILSARKLCSQAKTESPRTLDDARVGTAFYANITVSGGPASLDTSVVAIAELCIQRQVEVLPVADRFALGFKPRSTGPGAHHRRGIQRLVFVAAVGGHVRWKVREVVQPTETPTLLRAQRVVDALPACPEHPVPSGHPIS